MVPSVFRTPFLGLPRKLEASLYPFSHSLLPGIGLRSFVLGKKATSTAAATRSAATTDHVCDGQCPACVTARSIRATEAAGILLSVPALDPAKGQGSSSVMVARSATLNLDVFWEQYWGAKNDARNDVAAARIQARVRGELTRRQSPELDATVADQTGNTPSPLLDAVCLPPTVPAIATKTVRSFAAQRKQEELPSIFNSPRSSSSSEASSAGRRRRSKQAQVGAEAVATTDHKCNDRCPGCIASRSRLAKEAAGILLSVSVP